MQPDLHQLLKNLPQDSPDERVALQFQTQLQIEAAKLQQQRRSPLARWGTRCATLAACIALTLLLLLPTNTDSFAAMQHVLRQSDYMSVKIDIALYVALVDQNLPLSTTHSWISRDHGLCSDIEILGKPAMRLWHPWDGDTLFINHIQQITTPIEVSPDIDPRELLQFNPAELIQRISQITGEPERIDSDGPNTLCYQLSSSQMHLPTHANVQVWVDRISNRPTQIVCDIPVNDGTKLRWRATDFAWEPDAKQMSQTTIAPPNYKLAKAVTIPTPSMDAVAESLRLFADRLHGQFPSKHTLPWQTVIASAMQLLQQPNALKNANLSRQEIDGLANTIAGSIYIMRAQQHGAKIIYHGNKVKLGDDATLLQIIEPNGKTQTLNGKLQRQADQP